MDEPEREQGIEFGDLAEDLAGFDYPTTAQDLVAAFGDRELELPGGTTTLEAVLEPYEGDAFEDDEEVRRVVETLVGEDAVGRAEYTDRGSSAEAPGGDETI